MVNQFHAVESSSGRPVAVKHVLMNNEVVKMRAVLAEVQILRKLAMTPGNIHTSVLVDVIVPYAGEPLNEVYIVSSMVPLNLQELLDNSKKHALNERMVIKIFYNLLCSVKYFHSCGLMHRDIRPRNILVRKDCNVMLTGFNAARPTAEDMLTNEAYRDRYLSQGTKDVLHTP